MSKTTGQLINRLIELNIWCYHPPGAAPTNGDIYKYKAAIVEITQELTQRLSKTDSQTGGGQNATTHQKEK